MSYSVWTFIEKRNPDTNEWEEIILYRKKNDEFVPVYFDFVGNADHSFMDLVFEDMDNIRYRNFPKNLSKGLNKFFYGKEDGNDRDYFGWGGQAVWFDYVELGLLADSPIAVVEDFMADFKIDENGNEIYPKRNVLKNLYQAVSNVLDMCDCGWNVAPGDVRVFIARAR